jgi:hypothetical protein
LSTSRAIKTRRRHNSTVKALQSEVSNLQSQIGDRPQNYGYYPDVGSDGSKYLDGIIASGSSILFDSATARNNTRVLEFKSPALRSIINRSVGTVIGRGLKARSEPKHKILGITPEQAQEWGENVDIRYDLYCRDKKSVANGNNNVYQEMKLIYRCQDRDGESFVRFKYSKKQGNQSPLQITTLDPAQINGDGFIDTFGTQYTQKDGTIKPVKIPAKGPRSGRTMMLHGFSTEYPGAGRGLSKYISTLQNFQDLNSYRTAVLKKAQSQASDAYAIENSINDPSNPREGEQTNFPAGLYGATVPPDSEPTVATAKDGRLFCPSPELSNQQPGTTMITNMRRGDTIRSIKETSPGDNYKDYITIESETYAAANNIPESIAKFRFQDSFSAQKGETMLYWDTEVLPKVDEFASDFPNPHREAWLSEEIAAGRIQAPGWSDPVKRQAWLACVWLGVVMPDDISKTTKAIIEAAKYNLVSLSDAALGFNGSDIKSNAAKNAVDFPAITPDPHEDTEPEPMDENAVRDIVQDGQNGNE